MGGRNERSSGAPIHQVRPPAPALWVWAHQLTPPPPPTRLPHPPAPSAVGLLSRAGGLLGRFRARPAAGKHLNATRCRCSRS